MKNKDKDIREFIRSDILKSVTESLRDDFYKFCLEQVKFDKRVYYSLKTINKSNNNFLMVLRRWNSFSPLISDSSSGGGYFLRWCGKGIIIDPGINFLNNFFKNGFGIDYIDAIIITHAHIDHSADFESLLTLIFEYNELNHEKKKIDVFMNLGANNKFSGWNLIDEEHDKAKIKFIHILQKGVTLKPEGYNLKITPTEAIHNEIVSKIYSIGLIFELFGVNHYTDSKPFMIGFTGDTRHDDKIKVQYEGMDLIVPHLGSVKPSDFNLEYTKPKGNHLLLKGVISTLCKSNAKLAVISEFGEELGNSRFKIVKALSNAFQERGMMPCLTGDIGLKIKIPDLTVKCHFCEDYVDPKMIIEAMNPEDVNERIFFCNACEVIYNNRMRLKKET